MAEKVDGRFKQPSTAIKVTVSFDEVSSKEIREFMEREGFTNVQHAIRVLCQHGVSEQPKNFPRGLWLAMSHDVRQWVVTEMHGFLVDLAKQLRVAAENTPPYKGDVNEDQK